MKRPHRFTITISGERCAQDIEYRLHDGNLEVVNHERELRTANPTIRQWHGFWRLCDFLDLWNWRPEYNEHRAIGGTSWQFDIAFDKNKKVHSEGDNTNPSLEDVKLGSRTMDRFALFMHFIEITLLTKRPDDFADYTVLD